MNMQMCDNGHFYDADVHTECPACKRPVEEMPFPKTGIVTDFPATGSYMEKQTVQENEYPKTGPVNGTVGEFPKTAPVSGASQAFPRTEPIRSEPQDFPKTAPVGGVEAFPKTMPIGGRGQVSTYTGRNPVLGWLVCVQGKKAGKDFRLTQEINYIGRATSNDVCLDFDETLSRDTTITITYVKQSRVFRLNAEQSRNPVTVNGSPVVTELYLRDRDVISIGSTQLTLVCFCDASFTWEN
ncbi:MAG: FHA domain-containing protein [Lachnospiraceae bacterium]|nr:FHA domain-containing protein [Lachnospiraceae bacterium]